MLQKESHNLAGVFQAQRTEIVAVSMIYNFSDSFRVIKDNNHMVFKISDLVEYVNRAENLRNLCLVGVLSLLEEKKVSPEMLAKKGAIVDFFDLVRISGELVSKKNPDIRTVKVVKKAIKLVLEQWETGMLVTCNLPLAKILDERGVKVMVDHWYENLGYATTARDELTSILMKKTDGYIDQVAKSEQERPNEHREAIAVKMNQDYVGRSASKVSLNAAIKQLRNEAVLSSFRSSMLPEAMCVNLLADARAQLLSEIGVSRSHFRNTYPSFSTYICQQAYQLQQGMPINSLIELNASAFDTLVVNWKNGAISAELDRELRTFLAPIVPQNLPEEAELIKNAVEAILNNPTNLKADSILEYQNTVLDVVRSAIISCVNDPDNNIGKIIIEEFSSVVLVDLRDPTKEFENRSVIFDLFNGDEDSLVQSLDNLLKPSSAGQNRFSHFAQNSKSEPVVSIGPSQNPEKGGPSPKK